MNYFEIKERTERENKNRMMELFPEELMNWIKDRDFFSDNSHKDPDSIFGQDRYLIYPETILDNCPYLSLILFYAYYKRFVDNQKEPVNVLTGFNCYSADNTNGLYCNEQVHPVFLLTDYENDIYTIIGIMKPLNINISDEEKGSYFKLRLTFDLAAGKVYKSKDSSIDFIELEQYIKSILTSNSKYNVPLIQRLPGEFDTNYNQLTNLLLNNNGFRKVTNLVKISSKKCFMIGILKECFIDSFKYTDRKDTAVSIIYWYDDEGNCIIHDIYYLQIVDHKYKYTCYYSNDTDKLSVHPIDILMNSLVII